MAIVLTMQPDAFRRGEGVSKYLQSRSLKENAHSVWRLALPTDPEMSGRVLEIVKTNHGTADHGKQSWLLKQTDDQRLEWNEAEGTELAPSKELLKHRDLVRVMEFLDQVLLVLGGVVYWPVLVARAAEQGIQPGLLRQAVTYWHLPSLFQMCEGELREVVGFPELIAILKEKQREEQAAAREALLAGRGPFGMDLAAGLATGLASIAPRRKPQTPRKPARNRPSARRPPQPLRPRQRRARALLNPKSRGSATRISERTNRRWREQQPPATT